MSRRLVSVLPTDSKLDVAAREEQHAVVVEVDRGSTSAKQAHAGRVWLVRLRRGNQAVILNAGLSHVSAEHLARELTCILRQPHTTFHGGKETMAQRVMLINDLDGSEGAETIRYSVDGEV
jgi:hypothetical protein